MNCKYTLLRYIPDIVKGEFVNLGVALFDEAGAFLEARMGGDEEMRRLRCLHPGADLEMLREIQAAFTEPGAWENLDKLREMLSASLTVAEPKLCVTGDWQSEVEKLFLRHVASPPRPVRESENPRLELRRRMEHRLRSEGLFHLMKPFPAAPFTVPGDPFRIDYAYVPATNGKRKYIHAVTLDRASHQAKVLAFTFDRIRRKRAHDEMTAVYDSVASRPIQELLESSEIKLRAYGEMNELVREIRQDLAVA